MEIHWHREKLRKQVLSFAQSNPITARRLVAIKAADSFLDLVCESNGRAHFLEGKYENHFSLDLEKKGNGKRLICIPVGVVEISNGQYVKETIKEFMVIKIDDTHKNRK